MPRTVSLGFCHCRICAVVGLLIFFQVAWLSFAQGIPGKFYEYHILAKTGDTPAGAPSPLTGIGLSPSINANGIVAFIGQFSATSAQGVVIASPYTPAVVLSPSALEASSFDDAVSINDKNQVLAVDLQIGSPYSTARLYDGNTPGNYSVLLQGGPPPNKYSEAIANGSVNMSNYAALPALSGNSLDIVTVSAGKLYGSLTLPANSYPLPIISNNNQVLVRVGQDPTSPIDLYNLALNTFTVIADSTNFTRIGNQPGMSDDGAVVAFYGEVNATGAAALGGPDPGIFASVDLGGGARQIIRVLGKQVCDAAGCSPAAELGFDASGNELFFLSFQPDTRIAVTNLKLTPNPPPGVPKLTAPIDGSSFIIAFEGTPSAASRNNPWIANMPLFFSSQLGIWTVRVDAVQQLSGAYARSFLPSTPIPVVQVNDTIGGNVITGFQIFDQIANAAADDTGATRTQRRGDHRVAFWAQTAMNQNLIIRASHLDSDQDGLLDFWETTGIDMNQDGIPDLKLAAMGADPNKRDMFVELDWMVPQPGPPAYTFQPFPGVISPITCSPQTQACPPNALSSLESMFVNAPALSGPQYGYRSDGKTPDPIAKGITLHIDGGAGNDALGLPLSWNMKPGSPLNGGDLVTANGSGGLIEAMYFGPANSVSVPGVTSESFGEIKDEYFGSLDKDARELAFHYGVIGFLQADFVTDASGNATWTISGMTPPTANTLTSTAPLPAGGRILKITSGSDNGQFVRITAQSGSTLTVTPNWTVLPAANDTFVVWNGYGGEGEIQINASPDFNSLPGNDFMVTPGGAVVRGMIASVNGVGLIGNACLQWRTIAHELGHTLGLRHGGSTTAPHQVFPTDYKSIMSYDWALLCGTVSPVQSYAGPGDLTFNDWGNLRHDFSDAIFHLGNTFGLCYGICALGGGTEISQEDPEQTIDDYITLNGAPDTTPPSVAVQSPKAGSSVGVGLTLPVKVTATDDQAVASVQATFDINGDGNTTDTGELITLKNTSGSTYQGSFAALTGPLGPRTLTLYATDASGLFSTLPVIVNVVTPNPAPALTSMSPSSATHGGPSFTLTLTGSNFLCAGSATKWNSSSLKIVSCTGTQLQATVPASLIAAAGTAQVTVVNPAPGGGTSGALTFTIN